MDWYEMIFIWHNPSASDKIHDYMYDISPSRTHWVKLSNCYTTLISKILEAIYRCIPQKRKLCQMCDIFQCWLSQYQNSETLLWLRPCKSNNKLYTLSASINIISACLHHLLLNFTFVNCWLLTLSNSQFTNPYSYVLLSYHWNT